MFKYLEECLERKDLEKNPVVTYGNHVSPGGSGKDKWGGGGEGEDEVCWESLERSGVWGT